MRSGTFGGTRFHYSSGLAGDVIVNLPAPGTPVPGEPDTFQVEIPGAALRALVLDALRDELIGRLEQAEGDELAALLLVRAPRVSG